MKTEKEIREAAEKMLREGYYGDLSEEEIKRAIEMLVATQPTDEDIKFMTPRAEQCAAEVIKRVSDIMTGPGSDKPERAFAEAAYLIAGFAAVNRKVFRWELRSDIENTTFVISRRFKDGEMISKEQACEALDGVMHEAMDSILNLIDTVDGPNDEKASMRGFMTKDFPQA